MESKSYEEILNENGSFLWKCVGFSMQPLIKEGRDYIYIEKSNTDSFNKYDVVLFKRPNVSGRGKYVLHRILKVYPNKTYWIVGDNCISGEIVKHEYILGILTYIKRNNKTINVTDFSYKIYIYLWCAPWPIRFILLRFINITRRIVKKILRIFKNRSIFNKI